MKKTVIALFASIMLLGAACNSTAEVETSAVTTASEEAAAGTAVDAAPEPAQAETTNTTSTNTTSTNTTSSHGSDWCAVASQVENSFDSDDIWGVSDPAQVEDFFTRSTTLINEAAQLAPSEIENDVAAMAEASTAMLTMLSDADWDFLAVDFAAFEDMTAGMETAGYNIEKYNFEVCGIGEDPDSAGLGTIGEELEDDVIEGLFDEDFGRDALAQFGLDESQMTCVLDNWEDFSVPSQMLNAMIGCDVPLPGTGG